MFLVSLCKLPAWRSLSSTSVLLTAVRMPSVTRLSTAACIRYQWTSRQILTSLFTSCRPAVMDTARRLFAKKATSTAFSVEAETAKATASKDLTIFTYTNDRFFKMLTIFGIIQFVCWANIALFFYSVPMTDLVKPILGQSPGSWWTSFSSWQNRHRKRIALACLGLGYMALMFTWIYPLRTVSNLTLLKGGSKLNITTYWHLGKRRQFMVPLEDVSCVKSRQASGFQVAMKIRGRRFHYLMDTREGRFIEPLVFDHVVGLNRNFK